MIFNVVLYIHHISKQHIQYTTHNRKPQAMMTILYSVVVTNKQKCLAKAKIGSELHFEMVDYTGISLFYIIQTQFNKRKDRLH